MFSKCSKLRSLSSNKDPNTLPVAHRRKTVGGYVADELDHRCMSLMIVFCFFVSGLIDSVSFNTWSVFVNMQTGNGQSEYQIGLQLTNGCLQTGNTIFAALGISGQPAASHNQQWAKSLTAIGSACAGALFFSFLHRMPNLSKPSYSHRRWLLFICFFLQSIFIISAGLLAHLGVVSDQAAVSGRFSSGSSLDSKGTLRPASLQNLPSANYRDLTAIALLGFQSGGQVCLPRVAGLAELPTNAVSSIYHFFMHDLYSVPKWYKDSQTWKEFWINVRVEVLRFCAIAGLFLGGIVGGEIFRSSAGLTGALWLAAALKVAISIAWLFWPAVKIDRTFSNAETIYEV